MIQDIDNNLIGDGEDVVFNLLKQCTKLRYKSLKHFSFCNGLYRQVPITFILSYQDMKDLSESHKNSSIDIFIKLNQVRIAVRVQGEGHGSGLKGLGKARFDQAQKNLLRHYCEVVDLSKDECTDIFHNRPSNYAMQELEFAFQTAHVSIPVSGEQIFVS